MAHPTVSVVIAAFNGAEFIAAQLDSILAQSIAVTEIVVCDDNSTDETWNILREYQRKNPEIFRIFRNEKNLGCAGNFEKALSLCNGEIIFLADQDDIWLADKVEKMLAPFADAKVRGVYSDSTVVNAALEPLGYTHLECRGYTPARLPEMPQTETFFKRVPPAAHDMALRKSVLKYLLPFPKLKNVHDTFIGITIAALNGWAVVSEPLTLFRQHGNNASNSGKKTGLAGQLQAAKRSAADDTFLWNAKLHSFVLSRLKGVLDDDTERLLKERIAHSANRSQMGKCGFFRRFFLVMTELFSLRYFHFARGIKSIIQDLFLR